MRTMRGVDLIWALQEVQICKDKGPNSWMIENIMTKISSSLEVATFI